MSIEGKLFVREGLLTDPVAQAFILNGVFTDVESGSKFDTKNRELFQKLSPRELIGALAQQGYEVMLGYHEGRIIGYVGFQEHRNEGEPNWQMFRMKIQPEYQGKGYSVPLAKSFIEKGREHRVYRLKWGDEATRNEKMVKLLRILGQKEEELGITVDQNSQWLTVKSQNPPVL